MKRCALALATTLFSNACFAATISTPTANPRVITLAPHLAEIVCAVGACGNLVGVSAYTDYPASAKAVVSIGDITQLNYERIISLKPSHIYAWQGGTPSAQISKLRMLGLPVIMVNIATLPQVATSLQQLGATLGHAKQGRQQAALFTQRIQRLAVRYTHARKVRVFYQIETAPAYTVSKATPISQVISLCGGINVFADLRGLSAPVSAEAILAAKPEVILHSEGSSREMQAYWARIDQNQAHPHRLMSVNGNFLARAGPRLANGAEAICAALDTTR